MKIMASTMGHLMDPQGIFAHCAGRHTDWLQVKHKMRNHPSLVYLKLDHQDREIELRLTDDEAEAVGAVAATLSSLFAIYAQVMGELLDPAYEMALNRQAEEFRAVARECGVADEAFDAVESLDDLLSSRSK